MQKEGSGVFNSILDGVPDKIGLILLKYLLYLKSLTFIFASNDSKAKSFPAGGSRHDQIVKLLHFRWNRKRCKKLEFAFF